MGKKTIFILVVTCILLLAGCGNQGRTEKAAEVNPAAQGNDDQTEEPEDGDSQAAEEAGIKQENTKPENTLEGQEDGTVSITSAEEGKTASSLTAEQIEDAKQVALVYYEGTVFSVNSIEYLEGELPHGDREGYCNFTVNVSRDGIVQEPNRTISLQLDQDGWKVVNEGY
ncbi:MAG: hypothetical protein HDT41_06345 [Lachnospiraceae bacterium]|nr:hypothetical protein [Lachnospiraceae bacterium]